MRAMESMIAAGVPMRVRRPHDTRRATSLIVLWHGFEPPDSAAALADALPLAAVDAFRVYVDLPLFGERSVGGPVPERARRGREDYVRGLFMPVVEGAVAEFPGIVAELRDRLSLGRSPAVGVFGFSGGAGVALLALAQRDVPIRAAVTLNAPRNLKAGVDLLRRAQGRAPYAWDHPGRHAAAQADPVARAAEIAGVDPAALLLLHGERDAYFPPDEAEALYRALRPHYARQGCADRLAVRVLTGLGHHLAGAGTSPGEASVDAVTTDWFGRHLREEHHAVAG